MRAKASGYKRNVTHYSENKKRGGRNSRAGIDETDTDSPFFDQPQVQTKPATAKQTGSFP
jgi:hypothetical protein